jgi:hypothetical protein
MKFVQYKLQLSDHGHERYTERVESIQRNNLNRKIGIFYINLVEVFKMRKSTTLTQFIQELCVILDKGNVRSIEEVNKHVELKDLVNWLEVEFPIDQTGTDFSMFQQKERLYIQDKLESIWQVRAGDESRKWGIIENGLCLLISWTTEVIRDEFGKDQFL